MSPINLITPRRHHATQRNKDPNCFHLTYIHVHVILHLIHVSLSLPVFLLLSLYLVLLPLRSVPIRVHILYMYRYKMCIPLSMRRYKRENGHLTVLLYKTGETDTHPVHNCTINHFLSRVVITPKIPTRFLVVVLSFSFSLSPCS